MYADDDTHITFKMGLLLASVGTAFFPLVYFSLRQLLKGRTAHLANSAEIASVVAMRLTSTLQAIMSSIAGFVAICYCQTDLVHDRSMLSDDACCLLGITVKSFMSPQSRRLTKRNICFPKQY